MRFRRRHSLPFQSEPRTGSYVRRFRPRLEGFEDRTVPAVVTATGDTYQVAVNSALSVPAATTQVVQTGDGEVALPPAAGSEFSGSTLPADWQVTPWSPGTVGGSATVAGGLLTLDGVRAGTQALYDLGTGRSLEFVATFTGDANQHVGFGTNFSTGTPWAIFSTGAGGALFARTTDGTTSQETSLVTALLGGPHDFRIDWAPGAVTYTVDGAVVATHTVNITTSMRPLAGDAAVGGGVVTVDSIALSPPTPPYVVDFGGTSLPADWSSAGTAGASVAGGQLSVDGVLTGTQAFYAPGRSLEFVATFTGDANQHVGFGADLMAAPWAIFSTGAGGALFARTNSGSASQDAPLGAGLLGGPHDFRIDWAPGQVTYFVDGTQVASHAIAVAGPMRPLVSDFNAGSGNVSVDWMRMSPFGASGTYLSRVFDAGATATWGTATWAADTPAGTGLTVSVRTGNTPVPDATWTAFAPLPGPGAAIPGASRYIQYRADLQTTDLGQTPALRSVTLTAASPAVSFTDTTAANFAAGALGTGILADDGDGTGGPLTAVLVGGPAHGSLTLAPDGSFIYAPAAGYVGPDGFVYQARSADGTLSAPATVSINVFSVVHTPTLTVADASGGEGAAIPLAVSAAPAVNDGSETVTVTIAGLPAGATLSHGTLAAGVWTLTPADLTGLTVTAPDNGSFALTVTATARAVATGATASVSGTLTLTVNNVAPTAVPSSNGPVTYGNLVTVKLTGPSDPSAADTAAGLHYAFALDPAALAGATYAGSGATPSASFSLHAGSYTVYTRVIDKDGGFTQYPIAVTVNKAALTITADNLSKTFGGPVPTLTAHYSGFVNGDTPASLATPPVLVTTATALSPVGTYAITVGGAASSDYAITYVPGALTVTAPTTGIAFLAPDPVNPGATAVFVSGTATDDLIVITKVDIPGVGTGVWVHISTAGVAGLGVDFVFAGQYSRIVAHGQAGDDNIWVLGTSALPTWLYGDDGDDRLLAGVDNSVLIGGAGNDLLAGSAGRDLLIGDQGADRIIGGGGDDILIGGTTSYDANEVALNSIMGVWTSSASFATRVAKISDASAQYHLIYGLTVFNDGSADTLTGDGGSDWFFAGGADKITDLSSADKAFLAGP